MLQQRTLKSLTRAVGVGLHSGQKVEMTLRPAAPNSGIVFRRIDLPNPVDIPVRFDSVSEPRMASTISPGGQPGGPKVQAQLRADLQAAFAEGLTITDFDSRNCAYLLSETSLHDKG